MKPLRRAGSPWRLLVHEWVGKKSDGPCGYRDSYNIHNCGNGTKITNTHGALGGYRTIDESIPGTEFDELVVGRWCHIEQMDTGTWWMNIGGVTLWVRADRDGRPKSVSVYGPGDYGEAVDGCKYKVAWTEVEP